MDYRISVCLTKGVFNMICARCKTKCDDNITYCPCCGNKLKVNPLPKENDKDATVFVGDTTNNVSDDSGTVILTENSGNSPQGAIKTSLISGNDESTVLLAENEIDSSNTNNNTEAVTSMGEAPTVNATPPTPSPTVPKRAPLKIPGTLYVGIAIVVIALIAVIVLL